MALPTIVPVGFAGNRTDFLKAKVSRDGGSFVNRSSVSVPSGTVVTTIVGLIPFQAGATVSVPALSVVFAALGASVTASIGVFYEDAANTDVPALFASAITTPAAGGVSTITPSATNLAFVAPGNGWIAVTLAGATTGSTGSITSQAVVNCFNGGVQA